MAINITTRDIQEIKSIIENLKEDARHSHFGLKTAQCKIAATNYGIVYSKATKKFTIPYEFFNLSEFYYEVALTRDERKLKNLIKYVTEHIKYGQFGAKVPESIIQVTTEGILFDNTTMSFVVPLDFFVPSHFFLEIAEWWYSKQLMAEFEKSKTTYLYIFIENGIDFNNSPVAQKGGQILSQINFDSGETVALIQVPHYIKHVKQQICTGIMSGGLGCNYSIEQIMANIFIRKTDYISPENTSIYEELLPAAIREIELAKLLDD